jgi:Fic family protein
MKWNWQQPDWPQFSWKPHLLDKAENLFLLKAGEFAGTLKHLSPEDHDQLTVESLSTEALTTSEIEGEILDRSSVQSSILRQLGLKHDNRRVAPKEQGIAEMMVQLHRSFKLPFSHKLFFDWHRMVMSGRSDIRKIGDYRTHKEPMQVVSGPVYSPKVHFEAPPSPRVHSEMSKFISWLNQTAPKGQNPLPALTRAGVAHLYFISIHPFEDGNGRIGRAVSEKILAQTLGQPTFTSLAATILSKGKSYYDALEQANKNNEISKWLIWFAETAIEAQMRTASMVDFLIEKTKLLDKLRGNLNKRQEKALLRVLREGPNGFKGGLSAGNYIRITGASAATATRDLMDLVEKGALNRVGENRYARYHACLSTHPIASISIDDKGNIKVCQ